MNTLNKILFLLEPSEKKRGVLLLMLILITAFFDMMGIASVLPFIAVLTNPEIVETNIILAYLYQKSEILGVSNLTEFLFFSWNWCFYSLNNIFDFQSFNNLWANAFYINARIHNRKKTS